MFINFGKFCMLQQVIIDQFNPKKVLILSLFEIDYNFHWLQVSVGVVFNKFVHVSLSIRFCRFHDVNLSKSKLIWRFLLHIPLSFVSCSATMWDKPCMRLIHLIFLYWLFFHVYYDEMGNASSASDYFDVKTLPLIIWVTWSWKKICIF